MFNALGTKQLEKIVEKSMKGIKRRLATKGIKIILESSGAKAILDASYDPSYGARPVERYLEGTVVTRLSRMLISGELTPGTIVRIEAFGDDSSNDDCDVPVAKKLRTNNLQYIVERDPDYEKEQEAERQRYLTSDYDYEMPDIEIVD
ncbi:ABC transporter ATPase [Nitzschia inconspicua]|uniref:ABC transporter ATPase n=1 Tax=Nitzschia inconspicua TaxID=303405 RepID=A0A9K3LKT6_9STRA|nr:ABC transporter ATPase [Nitzschia inconspicua]